MSNLTKNVSPEDKKMLNSIFLRSFSVFASCAGGSVKAGADGWLYSVQPALNRYYADDPEARADAMKRHTTWYNITQNAVESDALRMTLSMGTPAGQKLLVKDVPDACRIANDPRADSMRIFALTNCVRDVLELVKGAPGKIEGVNVANVGRFDKSDPDSKVALNSTIMLNPDELEAAKELCEQGIPVFHQLIPSNPKTPLKSLIEAAEK